MGNEFPLRIGISARQRTGVGDAVGNQRKDLLGAERSLIDLIADRGGLPLVRMRGLLRDVVAARSAAGDSRIGYLDGLSLFGAADAHLLPDDLHPNTEGYRLMGERFNALMLSGDQPLIRA